MLVKLGSISIWVCPSVKAPLLLLDQLRSYSVLNLYRDNGYRLTLG